VNVPEQLELVLPEDQAVLFVSICPELLINASKYAGTGEATVELEYRDDQLRIHVRDQGAGFDVPPLPLPRRRPVPGHPNLGCSASGTDDGTGRRRHSIVAGGGTRDTDPPLLRTS
jgi:hypothetical protein